MKMEAILAKTVSGRIASVLILYQVDFSFSLPRIAQTREVYLVLLHLEALSSQIYEICGNGPEARGIVFATPSH